MKYRGRYTGHPALLAAICLLLTLAPATSPATTRIVDPQPADTPPRQYILWYRNYNSPAIRALVNLALDKTPEYGRYQVVSSSMMVQQRALRELLRADTRTVDIVNVATSQQREEELTAIPIPIDGGLLGFRVCVTLRSNLPLFENMRSLNDFRNRKIRIGQGQHWPDTQVLRAGGIPVVTHPSYETLFVMLRNQRFECFARGVSEVLYDLELEGDPNLVVEPNLLLAYPMPTYLFVNPADIETAQRLQLGLERAIEDGSFRQFLADYYQRPVHDLQLEKRTILMLDNPNLSDDSRAIGRQALETLRNRIRN
ncbi:MAG: hypothetical protein EP339_00030 [Gammaproteobacteria bacterium]|nr:MAG: hypothetical protein EP339_00030 [Gammaproteobacteria bacterium]